MNELPTKRPTAAETLTIERSLSWTPNPVS